LAISTVKQKQKKIKKIDKKVAKKNGKNLTKRLQKWKRLQNASVSPDLYGAGTGRFLYGELYGQVAQ